MASWSTEEKHRHGCFENKWDKIDLSRNVTSLVNETMDVLRPRHGKCKVEFQQFCGSCCVCVFVQGIIRA